MVHSTTRLLAWIARIARQAAPVLEPRDQLEYYLEKMAENNDVQTASAAGADAKTLEGGKAYSFTGNAGSLTVAFKAPDNGSAHYHFAFVSGSTPTVLTMPAGVVMPDGWTGCEANKRYEVDVLDNYAAVLSWTI